MKSFLCHLSCKWIKLLSLCINTLQKVSFTISSSLLCKNFIVIMSFFSKLLSTIQGSIHWLLQFQLLNYVLAAGIKSSNLMLHIAFNSWRTFRILPGCIRSINEQWGFTVVHDVKWKWAIFKQVDKCGQMGADIPLCILSQTVWYRAICWRSKTW